MKAYILYHSPCWDGAVAAAIAKKYFDKYEKETEAVLVPFDYAIGLTPEFVHTLRGSVESFDVYLLDVSFDIASERSKADLAWLIKIPSMKHLGDTAVERNVYWLDHHDSSFEAWENYNANLTVFPPDTFTVFLEKTKSGALLTYDFFLKKLMSGSRPNVVQYIQEKGSLLGNPDVIEYISDYDTWTLSKPSTKDFIVGCRRILNQPTVENASLALDWAQEDILTAINTGARVLEDEKVLFERISSNALILTFGGIEFISISHTDKSSTSNLAAFLISKYKMPACVYCMSILDTSLSFRSTERLGEIRSVAKAYAGGGHNYAAGGRVKNCEMIKILYKGRTYD